MLLRLHVAAFEATLLPAKHYTGFQRRETAKVFSDRMKYSPDSVTYVACVRALHVCIINTSYQKLPFGSASMKRHTAVVSSSKANSVNRPSPEDAHYWSFIWVLVRAFPAHFMGDPSEAPCDLHSSSWKSHESHMGGPWATNKTMCDPWASTINPWETHEPMGQCYKPMGYPWQTHGQTHGRLMG